jgi:hypothetical protein
MLHNVPVARILAFLYLASTALFVWMVVQGYRVSSGALGAERHIRFALYGLVVILFTHTMTMFYFVGTGSRIKKVVREFGLAADFHQRTLVIKSRLFPWLTFTPLMTMAAFIVGGAAHTRVWPSWIHESLALLSLGMNLVTAWIALRCIAENVVLIDEIDAALPEDAVESS